MSYITEEEEEDFAKTKGPLRCSSSALSRRGLNPIKLAYTPNRPDEQLG